MRSALPAPASRRRRVTWLSLALGLPALAACSHGDDTTPPQDAGLPDGLSRSALLDPQVCGSCHADHYRDWLVSMHAYASDDPVFLAMNARGQRETDGGLGTFCVSCHAPMAVRDGLTNDGLNLASLPPKYHGVTCFFCHTIDSVDGTHNAAVVLSVDTTMRGEIPDPVANSAHPAAYSMLHDESQVTSSASLCGACHDIVVPPGFADDAGAHIERTFAEWQASAFSSPGGESCTASSCHMVKSSGARAIAQQTGLRTTPPTTRTYHAHDFPAVDVRLTAPDGGTLDDAGVTEPPGVANLLANAIVGDLCATQAGGYQAIRVVLDTPNLGHDFPSGAAQDRRLWAEVVAYQGTDVVYQSGVVPFGDPAFDAGADPDLWLLRDCIFDPQGDEVHMFWQAATYEGNELPAQNTFNTSSPAFMVAQRAQAFPRGDGPLAQSFDRVTLNLWVQPVGADVLANLVDSGDLAPAIAAAMPKLPVPFGVDLSGQPILQLVWTPQLAAQSPAQVEAEGGVLPYVDMATSRTFTCVGTLPTPDPFPATNHTRCSP